MAVPRTRAAAVFAAGALVLVAAGPAGAAAGTESEFTITVYNGTDASGGVRATAKLKCLPAGGTHPRPVQACRKLDQANGEFTKLTPARRACRLDYLPVTVVAHGTWKGKTKQFTGTYSNQCMADNASGDVFDLRPERS
jgi:hypothetical protein